MKNIKELAHDVIDTSAPDLGRVHDIAKVQQERERERGGGAWRERGGDIARVHILPRYSFGPRQQLSPTLSTSLNTVI